MSAVAFFPTFFIIPIDRKKIDEAAIITPSVKKDKKPVTTLVNDAIANPKQAILNLTNMNIDDDCLVKIIKLLSEKNSNHISYLHLSQNSITALGLKSLVDDLSVNVKIIYIDFSNNNVLPEQSIPVFKKILKINITILNIKLSTPSSTGISMPEIKELLDRNNEIQSEFEKYVQYVYLLHIANSNGIPNVVSLNVLLEYFNSAINKDAREYLAKYLYPKAFAKADIFFVLKDPELIDNALNDLSRKLEKKSFQERLQAIYNQYENFNGPPFILQARNSSELKPALVQSISNPTLEIEDESEPTSGYSCGCFRYLF